MADSEYEERIERLRPKLTDEFLQTLVEASEVTMFDYVEIGGFISEIFEIAGKEKPSQT